MPVAARRAALTSTVLVLTPTESGRGREEEGSCPSQAASRSYVRLSKGWWSRDTSHGAAARAGLGVWSGREGERANCSATDRRGV